MVDWCTKVFLSQILCDNALFGHKVVAEKKIWTAKMSILRVAQIIYKGITAIHQTDELCVDHNGMYANLLGLCVRVCVYRKGLYETISIQGFALFILANAVFASNDPK